MASTPTFFQQTRKAFAAAAVAFVATLAGAVPGILSDGKVETPEVALAVASAVALAAAAFGATFGVTNAKGDLSA